jgi:hypothetical protein
MSHYQHTKPGAVDLPQLLEVEQDMLQLLLGDGVDQVCEALGFRTKRQTAAQIEDRDATDISFRRLKRHSLAVFLRDLYHSEPDNLLMKGTPGIKVKW